MSNPVVHFEVVGRDAEALKRFYGQAFDWRIESVMPEYAMVHPDDEGGIPGGIGAAPGGQAGHVTVYVQVDDLDAALARIEELGGHRVAGPMDVPDGPSIALFADPEEHLVGLVKG